VAPLLSVWGLEALRQALAADDPQLLQSATTVPPPIQCAEDWPCLGACALGYCGWQGDGLETVAEVEEFFARMCLEIDWAVGEQGACRYFLNWYDETPREQMRRELLEEVQRSLTRRLSDKEGAGADEDEGTAAA
jgi:hypothetical protein